MIREESSGEASLQPLRFGALVDRHLDAIAQALRDGTPADAPPPPGPAGVARISVALPGAVKALTPRNLVVGDETAPASRYHVFGALKAGLPFALRATLAPEGDGTGFVEAAYAAILERRPDENGRATYVKLLQGGFLTAGDFIASLASSDEARERPGFVLVVPDTSAWLSGLAADPSALAIRPEWAR